MSSVMRASFLQMLSPRSASFAQIEDEDAEKGQQKKLATSDIVANVLVAYRAVILAEFLDVLGDAISFADLYSDEANVQFVPLGAVVLVLSATAFMANIGGKFYVGVPPTLNVKKSGSAEQRLLQEKRAAVYEQERTARMTIYECAFIAITLCVEDLASLLFTSYVLTHKEDSRSAQFANLSITACVVIYQIISVVILWNQSQEATKGAKVFSVYLDAATALRKGQIEQVWAVLSDAQAKDPEVRAALCSFEDETQTLLSVAIDTEHFEVAEGLLALGFVATEAWAEKQASTRNLGEDVLWKAMVHTNPSGFDKGESPWTCALRFWKKDEWSKGGVCKSADDAALMDAQEALINDAIAKPLPQYLHRLGCRRLTGSEREGRRARDALTYGTLSDVKQVWLQHFSPYSFLSCFMYNSKEKNALFYDPADAVPTAERTKNIEYLRALGPHPDMLTISYRWTPGNHKFMITMLQDTLLQDRLDDAKALMDLGADPMAKSGQGQTAIDLAKEFKKPAFIQLFKEELDRRAAL